MNKLNESIAESSNRKDPDPDNQLNELIDESFSERPLFQSYSHQIHRTQTRKFGTKVIDTFILSSKIAIRFTEHRNDLVAILDITTMQDYHMQGRGILLVDNILAWGDFPPPLYQSLKPQSGGE